jgi:hypothetical protein
MYFNWLFCSLASSDSALPDDGDYIETRWSCFKVNFNITFKILYISKILYVSKIFYSSQFSSHKP